MNSLSELITRIRSFLSQEGLIDRFNPYAFQIVAAITLFALFWFILITLINRHRGGSGEENRTATAGITAARASRERLLRRRRLHRSWTHSFWYGLLVVLVLALGAFLRFWNLSGLPDGLQQDEASIGYEAYSLLHYGIDRNGYHFPVYPITWGSGGGSPIMIYLNVLTTALFGSSVGTLRALPAFLGVLTLLLFYCMLKKAFGNMTALGGLLLLTLTPWHIMLSRWSLDSNTMPFWQILAALAFLCAGSYAVDHFVGEDEAALSMKKQTHRYALAAFLFGLCMYSYGSANFIIPAVLLIMAIWGIRHQILSGRQLAGCIVIFALTTAPLAYFYGVNFLGFPEITTRFISFPRFTASHFGSVFLSFDASLPENLLNNAIGLLQMLTFGKEGEVSWNAMPGYWTLYLFTWPVTFLGIILGGRASDTAKDAARVRKEARKNHTIGAPYTGDVTSVISYIRGWKYRPDRAVDLTDISNAFMRTSLIVAMIFALFVQQDINRNVLLFLPLVYWNVMGLRWIWRLPLLRRKPGKTRKELRAEKKAAKAAVREEAKAAKEAAKEAERAAREEEKAAKAAAKQAGAAAKPAAKEESGSEKSATAAADQTAKIENAATQQDAASVSAAVSQASAAADEEQNGLKTADFQYEALTPVPEKSESNAVTADTAGNAEGEGKKTAAESAEDELPIELQFMDDLVVSSANEDQQDKEAGRKRKRRKRPFYPGHPLAAVLALVYLAGAILFCEDYYGGTYNRICSIDFMPGYGDAMVYADNLAQNMDALMEGDDTTTIYSTNGDLVAAPFMITLYYTKYNPFKFLNSVQYRNPDAEFRMAISFGHFVFGMPEGDESDLSSLTGLTAQPYWNDIFVLTKDEAALFSDEEYNKQAFHDRYFVVSRK